MKKFLLCFVILVGLTCSNQVKAQYYKQAAGITIGTEMGFSYKCFLSKLDAIEASAVYNIHTHGIMFTGLYGYHFPLMYNFSLVGGGGINMGGYYLGRNNRHDEFVLGITPLLGFEYKVDTAPIVFSLNYKPNINFTNDSQWNIITFNVRYVF